MRRLTLVTLALAAALAGCEALRLPQGSTTGEAPHTTIPTPDPEARRVRKLVDYYHTVERLEPSVVLDRFEAMAAARQTPGCTVARVRSAMLMTRMPTADRASDAEAILAPCLDSPAVRASTRGALAALVARALEWRARNAQANHGAAARQQALEKLRAENAELRKQLEGLKAIEESLQRRDRRNNAEE